MRRVQFVRGGRGGEHDGQHLPSKVLHVHQVRATVRVGQQGKHWFIQQEGGD